MNTPTRLNLAPGDDVIVVRLESQTPEHPGKPNSRESGELMTAPTIFQGFKLRLGSGKIMTSSQPIELSESSDHLAVRTRNSLYLLYKPQTPQEAHATWADIAQLTDLPAKEAHHPIELAPADFETSGVPYGAWCKCSECGFIGQSTFTFDFYGKNNGPLKCEACARLGWAG